jgi:hypothetical protein
MGIPEGHQRGLTIDLEYRHNRVCTPDPTIDCLYGLGHIVRGVMGWTDGLQFLCENQ